jgi:peroxiredoxin
MAREQTKMHDTGDFFPVIEFETITGETVVLPGDLIGKWSVVLFYRGQWCPYCRQQLKDFANGMEEFNKEGIEVVAASTDPKEDAQKTAEEYGVTFKVGYGLNAVEVSAQTGAFYDKDKGHLHATGFILVPDGMIANAVYSTGAVGRLVAADCLALIRYLRDKKR